MSITYPTTVCVTGNRNATVCVTGNLSSDTSTSSFNYSEPEFRIPALEKRLDKIERHLGLITRRPELEKDWTELRLLAEAYQQKKEDIESKLNMMDILGK